MIKDGRVTANGHHLVRLEFTSVFEMVDFVHEIPDQKDATPARLEQVVRLEGILHRRRIEPFTLIADRDQQTGDVAPRRPLKIDKYVFGRIVAVAMLDRVDDGLTNRHLDPVHRVLVEPERTTNVFRHDLHEIQHVHPTGELEADDPVPVQRDIS